MVQVLDLDQNLDKELVQIGPKFWTWTWTWSKTTGNWSELVQVLNLDLCVSVSQTSLPDWSPMVQCKHCLGKKTQSCISLLVLGSQGAARRSREKFVISFSCQVGVVTWRSGSPECPHPSPLSPLGPTRPTREAPGRRRQPGPNQAQAWLKPDFWKFANLGPENLEIWDPTTNKKHRKTHKKY